jgi:hypothetical protein
LPFAVYGNFFPETIGISPPKRIWGLDQMA